MFDLHLLRLMKPRDDWQSGRGRLCFPKAIKLRAHGRHPYLKRDDAGITYVDYLLLCTSNLLIRRDNSKNKNVGLHPLSWLALMEKHKTALEASVKELNEASPEFLITLSKYHSLAYYHNSYLKQLISGSGEFPVDSIARVRSVT